MPAGERSAVGVLSGFRQRGRLLGRPWFLGFIFVLALNDHLLKRLYPGWWSGKLSDFAGVAIVGTVASMFVGRAKGLVLTGIGFLILKTLPGAAELAEPFLGGVTSRDTSDLLALSILIPLAHLLGPDVGPRNRALGPPHSPSAQHTTRRSVFADLLSVAGAVLALVATTATSCGPSPAVTSVASDSGIFYAFVDRGWGEPEWALSKDGGLSWRLSDAPTGYPSPPEERSDPFEDPGPAGPLRVCASDETCWRVRDRRVIERRSSGGDWIEEFRLSDGEFSSISTGCAGGQVGVLGSIALAEEPAGPQVIVSFGAQGVLVRETDGVWEQNRVLSAPPIQASMLESAAFRLVLLLGPILFVAIWLVGRRRWPSWRQGLLAVGLGWFLSMSAAGFAAIWAGGATDPERLLGPVAMAGMVVTSVVAVATARRTPRRSPEALLAPVPRRPDIG